MKTGMKHQAVTTVIEKRLGLAQGASAGLNIQHALEDIAGSDLDAYAQRLSAASLTDSIWQELITALNIGETYFFRSRAQLDWIERTLLPNLNGADLNIWSAGCATGEETYSIAITLQNLLTPAARSRVQLMGTDISKTALETATRGTYREWSFRHTDPAFRQSYFEEVPGGWQINPSLREMTTFRQLNLVDSAPLTGLDIIFCCNVLLYFTSEAIRKTEEVFFHALKPGGWLLLGQAEMLRFARDRWIMHVYNGMVVYQKPPDAMQARLESVNAPLKPASLLQSKPLGMTVALYDEAVPLVRTKQYESAQSILNTVLAANPQEARAHVLLGSVLANLGHIEAARRAVDDALRWDPLRADAHYLKGVLYLETGRAEPGKDALRSALYCQPGHPLAAMILGNLYMRADEAERARRTWEAALEHLVDLPAEQPVSDLSDMTAASVTDFLRAQLTQFRAES
jgi:chemotaxis protein methyltransferase CheR